ncbi:hypothetical protein HH_0737 [Helicobacter hepaticus ATCC 51449]|uniref:Uncharacterized protein n=1 Tax=Helicobacter hepaticus (strain ATCC 51449 / 3B1) TaxID=235279 RepID=Q7VI71_HELHP|nr:hypothetical protein HH_0737 [Helicobacter hepaticus ATCC 51449]
MFIKIHNEYLKTTLFFYEREQRIFNDIYFYHIFLWHNNL